MGNDRQSKRPISSRIDLDAILPGGIPGKETGAGQVSAGTTKVSKDGKAALAVFEYLDAWFGGDLPASEVPDRYRKAVGEIEDAVNGGGALDAIGRANAFDRGVKGIAPAIALVRRLDADLAKRVLRRLDRRRTDLQEDKAWLRMKRGDIYQGAIDDNAAPAARAKQLRSIVQHTLAVSSLVVSVLDMANGDAKLDPEVREALIKAGKGKEMLAQDALEIGALNDALGLASTLLSLSEVDVEDELAKINDGPLAAAETLTELLAIVGQLVAQAGGLVLKIGAALATALGKTDLALKLVGYSGKLGTGLGWVVAALQIVHGLVVLCDSEASAEDKWDAGVEVVVGASTIAGLLGVASAGPLGIAIAITWELTKAMFDGINDTANSITEGYMRRALDRLGRAGTQILAGMQKIATAQLYMANEADTNQQVAFDKIARRFAAKVGGEIDDLLADLEGGASYTNPDDPGGYSALRNEFAGLDVLAGKTEPGDVLDAGETIVKKILWCVQHAPELADESNWGAVRLTTGIRRAEDRRKAEEQEN